MDCSELKLEVSLNEKETAKHLHQVGRFVNCNVTPAEVNRRVIILSVGNSDLSGSKKNRKNTGRQLPTALLCLGPKLSLTSEL